MPPLKVLFVFGTRPEAVKFCPLILAMRARPEFSARVCVTAQHREMLDAMLGRFGVAPDDDLDVMEPNQPLGLLTARILERLDDVLLRGQPDLVLVQGDTTTTFAGALAAFYRRIPVGHVEAGLRTGDLGQPFPEEANRVLASRLAALHFAPTPRAAENLRREGVPTDSIFITGNTGIDALLYTRERLERGEWPGFAGNVPAPGRKLILMTAHRRESFGEGFLRICEGVRRIAARGDTEIVYPVHPNPNVRGVVERELGGLERVHLIEPLDYVPFVDLMRRADLLLTDSGGVQEEGPSFGKPVLVMREKTERQEAVEAGAAILVGTDPDRIAGEAGRLLDSEAAREPFTRVRNPFGDGRASQRIMDAILSFFGTSWQSSRRGEGG
ncbi:MAG: UDP-N-acetylglucosamine 2-epimerase (non-hydrolyzing) [Bryobacteraceae bacterium]|nr:UDP-N-acetylglucosamine 2-epimerase (non-hydrolyzing) [Bryobacteraceae bacterium]